jgi:hypothetical protein
MLLLLLWLWCCYAKACCGTANATAVIATATTIATIANVMFLWFISQRLFSTMLYLRCITTTANNREEIVDILELGSIH